MVLHVKSYMELYVGFFVDTIDASPAARHTRIEPERGWAALNLRELWAYRDLLAILMQRDIRLRYRQTALGVIWVVLQPLAAALIFAAIFGRFARLPSNGIEYMVFVYAGLLPWNLFAGAVQRAGNSLVTDSRLISKVYFPRMVIPLASAASVLVDFAVSLVVMLVLLLLYDIPLTANLLLLPLFAALGLLIALGVSLFFSALNVYYRDFMYALPFLLQIWMYASPVVYSTELIPAPLAGVYALNPMAGVIAAFRWSLLGQGEFPLVPVALSLVIGLVLFILGAFTFQRIERSFADVV